MAPKPANQAMESRNRPPTTIGANKAPMRATESARNKIQADNQNASAAAKSTGFG